MYKTPCMITADCCCASVRWPAANIAPCTQRHCAISKRVTLYTRCRRTGSNYICCVCVCFLTAV